MHCKDRAAACGAGEGFDHAIGCAGFDAQIGTQLVNTLIMNRIDLDLGLANGGQDGTTFFKRDLVGMVEHGVKAHPVGRMVLKCAGGVR